MNWKDVASSRSVKNILVPALFFAVITLIIFRNYFSGSFFVGTDAMGPPTDFSVMFNENSYFSAWRDMPSLGHIDFPSVVLSSGYYLMEEVLHLSAATVFKIFVVGFFWLAGFAMYLCSYGITKNRLASVTAGIVYIFSQIYLSQITENHHLFIAGYAVLPFLFLCFYKTITEHKSLYAALLPVFAFILGSIGSPHIVLITAVFLILFILVYTLLPLCRKHIELKNSAFLLFTGILAVAVLVMPMALSKFADGGMSTLSTVYTIEAAQQYSSYSLLYSFLLQSTENSFIHSEPSLDNWTILSGYGILGYILAFAVPLAAFYSLKIKKERRLLLSLAIPSLIFIVLACGPNSIFGSSFKILFDTVPLMDSIRVYSRLHLLTGFAYALMVGMLVTHADELRHSPTMLKGIWKKIRRDVLKPKVLAVALSVCIIFSSSAVLSGEIKSFNLPGVYAQPYEDLAGVDGNFRILNLPYAQVYYTPDQPRFDGYPSSQTPEVGMYSPYISGKMYAFGLETEDYWSFLGSAIYSESFGYKTISELLGGTADVRFIVVQVHTPEEEARLFASLQDLTVWKDYESGATIYENQDWLDRIHQAGDPLFTTGPRQYLIGLSGMGIADLAGLNILAGYPGGDVSDALESMGTIATPSLEDFVMEMEDWGGAMIMLSDLGSTHTTDGASTWIYDPSYYMGGYSAYPGVSTTGKHTLDISVNADTDGTFSLWLDMIFGPGCGTVTVYVDGKEVAEIDTSGTFTHSAWTHVADLDMTKGSHKVTLSTHGDGKICLQRTLWIGADEYDAALSRATELLTKLADQTAFVLPVSSSSWDGVYLPWLGEDGYGIGSFYTNSFVVDGKPQEVKPGETITLGEIPQTTAGVPYTIELNAAPLDANSAVLVEVWENNSDMPIGTLVVSGADMQGAALTVVSSGGSLKITLKSVGQNTAYLDSLSVSLEHSYATHSIDLPYGGDFLIRVAGESAGTFSIDGEQVDLQHNGDYLEAVIHLEAGVHELRVDDMNFYGVSLLPADFSVSDGSAGTIEFTHPTNTDYTIKTSSENWMWMIVADSYSDLWVATLEDGTVLDHIATNSMANAYYVPPGEHTITLHYEGQETYNEMLLTYLVVVAGAAVVMFVVVRLMQNKKRGL